MRRATPNPSWTSDQTHKAQCSLAHWNHGPTPYLPLPSPPVLPALPSLLPEIQPHSFLFQTPLTACILGGGVSLHP